MIQDTQTKPLDLKDARSVGLAHTPASAAALTLVCEIANRHEGHLLRSRPLGRSGRETLRQTVGTILADLLRAAFRGRPVSAARGHAGAMWRSSPVGYDRFWRSADAMIAAGLLHTKRGVKLSQDWGEGPASSYTGLPTALWPSDALMALAAEHGVTAETAGSDWRVSRAAETRVHHIAAVDTVQCYAGWDDAAPGGSRTKRERHPAALSMEQQLELEALRARVGAFNAHVATAEIRGCLAPAFRRTFRHSLRLGGRLHAVGAARYQGMTPQERRTITIDGESVVEVDISAAHLSIFLALSGAEALPEGDLYAVGKLPRDVVKTWCVQTLGGGRHLRRWADNTPSKVRETPVGVVRKAVLEVYPALSDIPAAIPHRVFEGVPKDRRGWAAGQHMVFLESEIIGDVLGDLQSRGVVGLPVYDSVIVPRSAEELTRGALEDASRQRLGPPLRVKS